MAKFKIISLLILCTLYSNHSEANGLREYRNDVREVYNNIKENLTYQLSSTERKALQKVKFTTSDAGLGAFAYKNMGRGHVTITLPIIYLNEQLAYAVTHRAMYGSPNCFAGYLERIKGLSDIFTKSSSLSNDELRDTAFVYFAEKRKKLCNGFTRRVAQSADFMHTASGLTNMATTWIVLHELAHHFEGHVDKPFKQCSGEIRAREKDADLWAVEMMSHLGMPFHVADSFHAYLVMMGNFEGLDIEAKCHFSSPERVVYMLKYDEKVQKADNCGVTSKAECRDIIGVIRSKRSGYKAIINKMKG